ncbi:uncharacterized protein IL334_003529 [Kwoniella shivajii]|uniref:Transcription initiation factor TFIID subunit 13 n=1 Tax=Kwoniella shivajii TaxID=564305 RepID=A0ABZ1CY40_9TREE|nr:hypothetical protein IL334_003529 [Kwoniella shivajii]
MSQFPNNNYNQQFLGQSIPNVNLNNVNLNNGNPIGSPNLANTPSPMIGVRPPIPNYNSPTASPTPNRSLQFNASQLASLTDFHQRQQALVAIQQAQQQARSQVQNQGQPATLGQAQPRPNLQAMQQVLQQRLQAQSQQNVLQFLQTNGNGNLNQHSITPSQLQTPPPLGHLRPSNTVVPQQTIQQSIPPRPISQNPAFNPALLNAVKIASNPIPIPTSISSSQPSNTVPRPVVPLTQTFTPPSEAVPKTSSPPKADSSQSGTADKEGKKDENEKEKPKEKKKRPPKKKKEKPSEELDKDKSDKAEEKKDQAEAATPTADKPVRPKKPRTEEEKAKRAEARRRKVAADKEKAAAAAAAAAATSSQQNGDDDSGVFTAGPTTPAIKDSTASVVNTAKQPEASKDKESKKDAEFKSSEPKVVAPAAPVLLTSTETRSRRQEGMRGSMRNEIARLMYGAGDVAEPDIDTVDYMEDMVVEFLADLCRPIPPLRPAQQSQPIPVPISFDMIRHRLSTSTSMNKYLERFDHMVYMSEILKAHRRIANPNLNDLVETVGNDYLGLDDQPTGSKRGGGDEEDGARLKKRGRPNTKLKPLKDKSEKRKPGPQKGWKLNRDPNLPSSRRSQFSQHNVPKRKYQRKPGANPPGNVKRETSMNT